MNLALHKVTLIKYTYLFIVNLADKHPNLQRNMDKLAFNVVCTV